MRNGVSCREPQPFHWQPNGKIMRSVRDGELERNQPISSRRKISDMNIYAKKPDVKAGASLHLSHRLSSLRLALFVMSFPFALWHVACLASETACHDLHLAKQMALRVNLN